MKYLRTLLIVISLFVVILIAYSDLPVIKAYFDFMAPGVPYNAMCEEVTVATSVSASLALPKTNIADAEVIESKLVLKNDSPGVIYIGSFRLTLAFGSQNLRVESVSLNDLFQCGFDQDNSFVRNSEGLAVFTVSMDEESDCAPVALEAGQSIDLAVIKLYGIGDGTTFVRIVDPNNTQFADYSSYLMDARKPEANILTVEDGAYQLVIGNGGKGESEPQTTTTSEPTNDTPTPTTTVPPTGISDWGMGIWVSATLLLMGILVSQWEVIKETLEGFFDSD